MPKGTQEQKSMNLFSETACEKGSFDQEEYDFLQQSEMLITRILPSTIKRLLSNRDQLEYSTEFQDEFKLFGKAFREAFPLGFDKLMASQWVTPAMRTQLKTVLQSRKVGDETSESRRIVKARRTRI
mmetsp:Transcript_30524/g.46790  ORF Transcript_30524/g.46790 Transcript_30524/m.46790 type:complete len:127 (-) Transcript_30524:17-397(-)